MQFLQCALIKRDVLLHEAFQIRDGVGMVDGFEVVPKRFAADGQSIFKDNFGLHEGQRVPLNGVGMVGESQHHILAQVPDKFRRKGTMSVELGLQGVQIGEGVMMHGMSFLAFEFGKRVALPCPVNLPLHAVRSQATRARPQYSPSPSIERD